MVIARLIGLFLLTTLPWTSSVAAQSLNTDCEAGFRQLIHMAQNGQLGDDVVNANVGVADNQARVELVRSGAPTKVLRLTYKRSPQTVSRYFDVIAGEGATESDVARVGRALDEVFTDDPFHVAALESPVDDTGPSLSEAWSYGGSARVLRVLERRMTVLASLAYTVVVIIGLGLTLLATVILLWGSVPPRSR